VPIYPIPPLWRSLFARTGTGKKESVRTGKSESKTVPDVCRLMEGGSPVEVRAGVEVKSGDKSSDMESDARELRMLWRGVDSFFRDLNIQGWVTYLIMTFRCIIYIYYLCIINIKGVS
jgi:hypothetical protein